MAAKTCPREAFPTLPKQLAAVAAILSTLGVVFLAAEKVFVNPHAEAHLKALFPNAVAFTGKAGEPPVFKAYAVDPGRTALLHDMHAAWPFFQAMLNNMGMVLAKTDLAIGRRYADALVVDPAVRDDVFGLIEREHDLARRWHARLTGSEDPLVDNPALARSIRNRFPYLDPLHVMQVELLRRYRAGDRDERVERGIQLTLNTIATGLRNSG